jgi:hypothetical protein
MDQLLDKITLADLVKSDEGPSEKLEKIVEQSVAKLNL